MLHRFIALSVSGVRAGVVVRCSPAESSYRDQASLTSLPTLPYLPPLTPLLLRCSV